MPLPLDRIMISSREGRVIRVIQAELTEIVSESPPFVLYRAADGGAEILVSLFKKENSSPSEIARLHDAYKELQKINSDVLLRASDVARTETGLGFILEYFNAIPLPTYKSGSPLDIESFLVIGIQLAEGLHSIHKNGICHGMLRPADILVDPETMRVKIWNIGDLFAGAEDDKPTGENELVYISPEQTGLIKAIQDHRADLYSLGIIFYELLANEVPFRSSNPRELSESHAVQEPLNPSKVNAAIPLVVSDIIMKLLSKDPEERYQNGAALQADLRMCLDQWKKQGRIERFEPTSRELLPVFSVPRKLYGRDQEIKELSAAFLRVQQGKSEAFFVGGSPGVGKTALIHEVRKNIIAGNGYFVEGKFDQLKKDIPYSAFRAAFGTFARQILAESTARIQRWKERVLEAVGSNGQIIIDIIPEIERIIGIQPAVSHTDPTESQNRFNRVMQKFAGAFAAQEHPFVLFLDDLQWVDPASLQLIKSLVTDPESKHLLLFGAYRDNEVGIDHPFKHMVADLTRTGVCITAANLPPLQIEHVNALIADLIISASDGPRTSHPLALMINDLTEKGASITDAGLPPLKVEQVNTFLAGALNCSREKTEPLARVVYQKTSGNPFFVCQMLNTLHEEQQLINDPGTGWHWNLEKIEQSHQGNTVVELLVSKIHKLCADTQTLLKLASCIGNKFDLETLAAVYEKAVGITYVDLSQAIRETLIVPLNAEYAFFHDRIQEAAYSLLSDWGKKEAHAKIGYLLLNRTKREYISQKIFLIVDQLNSGADVITALEKRLELADLNLVAGRKAKTSTAFSSAAEYFSKGIALLNEESWHQRYELALALHLECSECLYLSGDFEGAEKLFSIILKKAKTNRDKAEVYRIWVALALNKGNPKEALMYGRAGLNLLGFHLPIKPCNLTILIEILKIRSYLHKGGKGSNTSFVPQQARTAKQIAIDILLSMGPGAYTCNKKLFSLIMLNIFSISLRYKNATAAPLGYVTYGFILSAVFRSYKAGYEFAKFGVCQSNKNSNLSLKARCNFLMGSFVNHWTQPLKTSLPFLLEGYTCALDSGNFFYAGYCAGAHTITMLFKGDSFADILLQSETYLAVLKRLRDEDMSLAITSIRRMALALKSSTVHPISFSDSGFDEDAFVQLLSPAGKEYVLCLYIYYLTKLPLFYLFDNFSSALAIAEELQKKRDNLLGMFHLPHHIFHYSLTLTALFPSASLFKKIQHWARLKMNQKRMRIWANNCPQNFLNKYTLVAAEMARVRGKFSEAARLYDEAIALSRQNEFVQEEAIANELAGKFYLSQKDEGKARKYLQDARACYERWGAAAKVKQLEATHGTLFNSASAVV